MADSSISRRGGGGTGVVGSGGIPSADLPQSDNGAVGLRFGLAHVGAGADWKLVTNERTLERSATIILSANQALSDSPRLVLSIGAPIARGALGNNWGVNIFRRNNQSVRIESGGRNIEILITGRTYAQVAALLNAVDGLTAVVTGNGGTAFPEPPAQGWASYGNFSGGVTENQISADVDDPTKTVTLHYHRTDTQQALLGGAPYDLGDGSQLYCTPIAGTTLATVPAAPGAGTATNIPFVGYFSEGALPKPTGAEYDGRIAPWARFFNPVGRAPLARLDDDLLVHADLNGYATNADLATMGTRVTANAVNIGDVTAAANANTTNIQTEATARADADTALGTRIDGIRQPPAFPAAASEAKAYNLTVAADGTRSYTEATGGPGPPPTPTTVQIQFGFADTGDGNIANAQTATLNLGQRGEIDFPLTVRGKYVVMIIPTGHRFTSVRSKSFPNIEALGDFTAADGGLRLYRGPLAAAGDEYDLLVTVEATG